jgi:hypothetical protein
MVDVWKEKVLLYKDLVTEIPNSLAPTSATWAKKHIFGFSDEEIKLDIQQQRLERAVAAELANTATVITHTGLFDNVDKLYKQVTGSTETPPEGGGPGGPSGPPPGLLGGGGPPPPPPPGEGPGGLPEGEKKDNLKILLESDDVLGDSFVDLSKAGNGLGIIEEELSKLLNR